ncbi:DUF6925 family protein [Xanthobacter sp. AM11]|uniref:DUF6925 family protein n=1 Tax=Xanthobacter sp. AM11 TaxID=3380643 RepID=UPI0039BF60DA
MSTNDVFGLLAGHVRDPLWGFSLGVFGAIAEFMRDPRETTVITAAPGRIAVVTERGGLRVEDHADARLVAYETPSRHPERRVRACVACLPEAAAALAGRAVVTELGPDAAALREQDRGALLFDLGVGLASTQACVRTRDAALIAALRAAEGLDAFAAPGLMAAMVAAGPHRVFFSALGRIEVFQPIPPPGGRSPDGPHTHVLPQLLAHRRTHAATVPVPQGWVPCLGIHPPADAAGGACGG